MSSLQWAQSSQKMGDTQSAHRSEATKDMIRVNEDWDSVRPRETARDETLRTAATTLVREEEKAGVHFRWG